MCGEGAMAEPLGCAMKIRWLNCGKAWVKLRWLKPIRGTRGGVWWGAMLTLVVKPQWVCYKLDETIKKSYSISWSYTIGSVYMVEWRFFSH
jgi:hypothetical protein